MSSAEIILKELERITGTNEVRLNPDLALYDEDILDSLGTVELIVALGEKLKIEISPAQINRQLWATPQKIIAYIDERIKG
jgi:D-alanine--poly(phosphoribitol) ligase subunit 2